MECYSGQGNRVLIPGNLCRYADLQQYLDQTMPERGIDFRQHILPRIHQLIIDSIVANKDELRQGVTRRCFELYGYDFMVGAALRLLVVPTLIAACARVCMSGVAVRLTRTCERGSSR